jgi:hypothetical protein
MLSGPSRPKSASIRASEVAGVKGLTVVGPLLADINPEIVYGGATTTAAPDPASAFVKFRAATEDKI